LTDSPQRYNRENRQADASFQESDLSAFRFDGFDNAHCFAAHGGKDVSRWLRARNLAILNRWVNSDLGLVIKVQAPKGAGVWDFVFRAVHNEGVVKFDALTQAGASDSADFPSSRCAGDERNQRMFAQIAHVVESVEKVPIPAWVWLERSQQRLDFRWRILRKTPEAIFKVVGVVGEGKESKFQVGVSGVEVCCGPNGMIKACPDVLDNLSSEDTPAERKSLSEADFVNFVRAIRVRLNNSSVWLFTEKTLNLGFQVLEMFLCPCDSKLGTVEAIGSEGCHGWQTI
jgi:hypothetical protein